MCVVGGVDDDWGITGWCSTQKENHSWVNTVGEGLAATDWTRAHGRESYYPVCVIF